MWKTPPVLVQLQWQNRPQKGSLEWRLGWLAPLLATVMVFLSRLTRLGSIKTLIFDETYYVKDAFGLVKQGYEVRWPKDYDQVFISGQFTIPPEGSFVVHPPVGKWLIGQGINLLGNNPWGWRIAVCLAGAVSAYLLGRIVWQLWGNWVMATLAVVLMGLDGIQIVMGRTAILDTILLMFILLGALFIVKDQVDYRPRLLAELRELHEKRQTARVARRRGVTYDPELHRSVRRSQLYWKYGPAYWWRPWLFAAGIAFGLAIGVKWSGLYPVAAFGIFVFIREMSARWATETRWISASVLTGGIPAFVNLVPISFVVYVSSWFSWAIHPQAWGHTGSGLFTTVSDWFSYHAQVMTFHTTLVASHPYKANPWGWLLQLRPTSFYFEKVPRDCGGDQCIQTITSLGNPALWWLGFLAFIVVVVSLVWKRDWRAGFIITGYFATWVPWLIYAERTIFTFYTVVISPFVILSLIYVLGLLRGAWRVTRETDWVSRYRLIPAAQQPSLWGNSAVIVAMVIIFATAVFFFPIWTGMTIPQDHFYWRMWLESWI